MRKGISSGTHDSLLDASQYIQTVEKRQGLKVSCPEEIAFRQGWIDAVQMKRLANQLSKNGYGAYLHQVLEEKIFGQN
jgi:glucose-1-phosphate thymidylyltransferase